MLWSPSRHVWFNPSGGALWLLATLYTGSWLLLLKSMFDSGLALQTGFLGWGAVWRNRKPAYASFPRGGTYRHVRQPIYVSFALILWSAPVWTPDRLFMTLLWTAYLVAGPLLKERRYRKWYGESFAQYARMVPYWIPRLKGVAREPSTSSAFHRFLIALP